MACIGRIHEYRTREGSDNMIMPDTGIKKVAMTNMRERPGVKSINMYLPWPEHESPWRVSVEYMNTEQEKGRII